MGFHKYANAQMITPSIQMDRWEDIRSTALQARTKVASNIVLRNFNPQDYLLSHCTIVASVDTENAGLPLGRQMVDGVQIDRQYDDYIVTANTQDLINRNFDCWERKLLLATYSTFVGAQNYLEHLQLPEMSKGKIVDAAARDIGKSVYIDILVATERKHKPLIRSIISREVQTLSMGCTVSETTCTKCGNVAEDETQLCNHIRFQKGQWYIDAKGIRRKIAELCGHVKKPKSCKFIEASWVAHPAFTGAVLRNILTDEEQAMLGNRIQIAMSMPHHQPPSNAMMRAARLLKGAEFSEEQQFPGTEESQAPAPAQEEDPMEGAVKEIADLIREKALSRVRGEMSKSENRSNPSENQNNTLIREASENRSAWLAVSRMIESSVSSPIQGKRILLGLMLHKTGGWKAVQARATFSGPEMLTISRMVDRITKTPRTAGEDRIYSTVQAVGGLGAYQNVQTYLAACRRVVGRNLNGTEIDALVAKGRIYDLGIVGS